MILTNYGFYLGSFFTVILCFSTSIYYDSLKNDSYSVIKSLFEFDRDFMLCDTLFCSCQVVLSGSGSWFTMFIPIISAFAFIPILCDKSATKSIRLHIFRSSKFNFFTADFISASLAGGCAVLFGFLIFILLVYVSFPNISEYTYEYRISFENYLNDLYSPFTKYRYACIIGAKCFEIFIYGMLSTIPAIVLSCITKNKYIVICVPFFLKYVITQTSVKLNMQAWIDFQNPNESLGIFANMINPDSILNILHNEKMSLLLLYNLALIIIAVIIYLVIISRKGDSGE